MPPLLHHEQMTFSLTHLLILGLPFLVGGLARLYSRLRVSLRKPFIRR